MKEVITVKEMNIDAGGFSFLCIFGEYINGGFLAIPEWNVCVDLSDADDFDYNASRILCGIAQIAELSYDEKNIIAGTIANAICREGYVR